ncbi:cellulose binding domain-containing protein [Streptomyces sp. NPDC005181]|uniref:cellulose binding domain-containing protein n=1 Tax=Streptomyces sp. NPDC005181 TaxID=3156869 RepID=UPI0033B3B4FC
MSPVKRSTHGCPGGLPVRLFIACAVAASLAGVPAAAAEQGTLHDLAAAHGKYFGSATDNPELPDAAHAATPDSEFASYGTWCDWSPLGCSTLTHRAAAVTSPKAGADHYLEVGFGSGSLAAGAATGENQLRLSKTDWSDFDESDDYRRTTGTSYADAPKVAVYIGGELAWGIEP